MLPAAAGAYVALGSDRPVAEAPARSTGAIHTAVAAETAAAQGAREIPAAPADTPTAAQPAAVGPIVAADATAAPETAGGSPRRPARDKTHAALKLGD